jgi:hypothetical protein
MGCNNPELHETDDETLSGSKQSLPEVDLAPPQGGPEARTANRGLASVRRRPLSDLRAGRWRWRRADVDARHLQPGFEARLLKTHAEPES